MYYIQYIKGLPLKEARAAEMAVMSGNYMDAENMLLQVNVAVKILLSAHLVLNGFNKWAKATFFKDQIYKT